jgi:hypothetical protein
VWLGLPLIFVTIQNIYMYICAPPPPPGPSDILIEIEIIEISFV